MYCFFHQNASLSLIYVFFCVIKYICKFSDLQGIVLKHMFYKLFLLIFECLICSYLNLHLNMRAPCLSVHVGFVFCMHVAVKKCVCV